MKSEIRYNEPPEIYHATRAISKSGMDKLRQAPAKFKAWMDGAAEEETEALLFGPFSTASRSNPASSANGTP